MYLEQLEWWCSECDPYKLELDEEEKSKHVGLAQQNWVFFFWAQLFKRTHTSEKEQPVREECNKYDLIDCLLRLYISDWSIIMIRPRSSILLLVNLHLPPPHLCASPNFSFMGGVGKKTK
jgi:hypothetical protein